MEEQGGYDLSFVSEVNDHLICVICQFVLRNPVSFIECGHRLCQSCYEEIREDAVSKNVDILCPHDRSKVDTTKVFEDKGMARMIGAMKVKCLYVKKGCDWVGELSNIKDHLNRYCIFEEKDEADRFLQTIQIKLNQYEERFTKIEKGVNKLKIENRQKEDEIKDIKDKFMKTKEEMNELKIENRQKDDEIKNIKDQLAKSEEKVCKMRVENQQRCEEVKNINEKLGKSEEKMIELKTDNQQRYDEIKNIKDILTKIGEEVNKIRVENVQPDEQIVQQKDRLNEHIDMNDIQKYDKSNSKFAMKQSGQRNPIKSKKDKTKQASDTGIDLPLGTRVICFLGSESKPYPGSVRFYDYIGKEGFMVGVELDEKNHEENLTIGNYYNKKKIFESNHGKEIILKPDQLIKEEEYLGKSTGKLWTFKVPSLLTHKLGKKEVKSLEHNKIDPIEEKKELFRKLEEENLKPAYHSHEYATDNYESQTSMNISNVDHTSMDDDTQLPVDDRAVKCKLTNEQLLLQVGSMVEIEVNSKKHYGVLKWKGVSERFPSMMFAGIELENNELSGCTNGTFFGRKYFESSSKRAFFVKLHLCQPDSRFNNM